MNTKQTITPCLWIKGNVEEAVEFYVSVFDDSRLHRKTTSPTDWPGGKAGDVSVAEFELAGQMIQILGGGLSDLEAQDYWDCVYLRCGSLVRFFSSLV